LSEYRLVQPEAGFELFDQFGFPTKVVLLTIGVVDNMELLIKVIKRVVIPFVVRVIRSFQDCLFLPGKNFRLFPGVCESLEFSQSSGLQTSVCDPPSKVVLVVY